MPFIDEGTLVLDPTLAKETTLDQYMRDRRAKVLKEMPNDHFDDTPLFKQLMGRKGDSTVAEKVEYAMQKYDNGYITVDEVFTNVAHAGEADPTTKIAAGDTTAAGTTIYLRCYGTTSALRLAASYRCLPFQEIAICDKARLLEIHADVQTITHDTTYAYITAVTMEADAPVGGASVLSQFSVSDTNLVCTFLPVAVPEYGGMSEGVFEEPTERHNMCQIFNYAKRTSGTENAKKSVFNESVDVRHKNQTFDKLRRQFEYAILLQTMVDTTDTLGLKTGTIAVERYGSAPTGNRFRMGGLRHFLATHEPSNIVNIPRTTTFAGEDFTDDTFDESGMRLFRLIAEQASMFGSSEPLVLCGSKALLQIQEMLENMSSIQRPPVYEEKWGFRVTKIGTLNSTWNFMQHAQLSTNPAYERDMFVVNPKMMNWRPFKNRDLHFIGSEKEWQKLIPYGYEWRDGFTEGWLMHGTVMFDNLQEFFWIRGVGLPFSA